MAPTRKTIEEQARERIETLKAARAEQEEKRKAAAEKRAKSLITNMVIGTVTITILAVMFSMVGFYYFAMLIGVAILPGFMAYITDVKPGKLASKSVLAMNVAGLFPIVVSIFTGGAPDAAAKAALNAPQTWLMVYGFSFAGWFLVFMIPQIIKLWMEIQADYSIKKMRDEQESLENEWGVDVRKLHEQRARLVKSLSKRRA